MLEGLRNLTWKAFQASCAKSKACRTLGVSRAMPSAAATVPCAYTAAALSRSRSQLDVSSGSRQHGKA